MSERKKIAVAGAGISGLAAAWLLARRHDVTLFEAEDRLGGHSHTVMAGDIPVDTGFIVYNEPAYPNLTALFQHLGVATQQSDMSFSVSLDSGRLEYSGSNLTGLFAQPSNLLRPRFWAMLRDIARFYREAPAALHQLGEARLDEYLRVAGFGTAFCEDHLYPMIAAIWSTPAGQAGALPAASFIRFCENHGLLRISGRPAWRTVTGGSREYIFKLRADFRGRVMTCRPVVAVCEIPGGVVLRDTLGVDERFDEVVLAMHADQALRLLGDATPEERSVLGAFRYTRNKAVLHQDPRLMPRRHAAWAAWNYAAGGTSDAPVAVTYWMNALQNLPGSGNYFVTLNPHVEPESMHVLHRQTYEHPVFDVQALRAQKQLWNLQGIKHRWFCGAYFGAGFHEDGLQAGLAVAEALGGIRRPWRVQAESARISLPLMELKAAA
jgi:predicted NAD/FAD-binding protein